MPGNHKITPSIYQIDIDKVRGHTEGLTGVDQPLTYRTANQWISRYHNSLREQGYSASRAYIRLVEPMELGQYEITVYGVNNSRPHAWATLFDTEIPDLFVQYPNLAAFIASDTVCYAISAGQGQTLFEQFVDNGFSIEIAKRVMKPEVDATRQREIAGAVYGQMRQFRTSQRIISSQTLGTVWQGLSGQLSDETQNSAQFVDIFDPDRRKISIDAGSSLTIRRSMEIVKLPDLIDWLEELQSTSLTVQQQSDFNFLDGLRQVSRRNKQLKSALEETVAADVLAHLNGSDELDYDYSHRTIIPYQNATSYGFGNKRELQGSTWESPPAASEVIAAITSAGLFEGCSSASEALDVLKGVRFVAEQDDPPASIGGTVYDHLHGEVEYNDRRYFLVDGIWYETSASFLRRLKDDYLELLSSTYLDMSEEVIRLAAYDHAKEGDYNDSYIGKDDWLNADRVFIENVEVADLIHWKDGKIYVVHNKIGFGASMRDVCSQVLTSMNLLNRITPSQANTYYDHIVAKHYTETPPPISKRDFSKLLRNKNITYVIGYVSDNAATEASRSSIAKFELVKLCREDSSRFKYGLKVVHIPRPQLTPVVV